MRNKYHIYLTYEERRMLLNNLNDFRNKLIAEGKMKLEAIKHQGITSRQVVGKVESADTVSSTESGRTVQRYIRLTYLIPQLLKLVDDERIAFSVGVELSYLDIYEQQDVFEAVELEDKTPSLSQAIQMKKLSQKGILDTDAIYKIISEDKPNQREKISLDYGEMKKFFPKQYTVKIGRAHV